MPLFSVWLDESFEFHLGHLVTDLIIFLISNITNILALKITDAVFTISHLYYIFSAFSNVGKRDKMNYFVALKVHTIRLCTSMFKKNADIWPAKLCRLKCL